MGVDVFGVSRFKDKVIVIAGAEHPLGASLCARLAGFGAFVVAIGRSEPVLMSLARTAPKRIDPLVLRAGKRDVLELLHEAWGDEPLDGVADLLPLLHEGAPFDAFGQSAGLAMALQAGLRAGAGTSVLAIPSFEANASASPEIHARSAGYVALLKRFSQGARPARHLGLTLSKPEDGWGEAQTISAGDVILTLFHPVSRGLRSGSLVDWAAEDA